MVMTERVGPNLSVLGGVLASSVALAGLIILPGLTCPPEKEKSAPKATDAVVATVPAIEAPTIVATAPGLFRADTGGVVAAECPPEHPGRPTHGDLSTSQYR